MISMAEEDPGDVLKGCQTSTAHVFMHSCLMAVKDLLCLAAADRLVAQL